VRILLKVLPKPRIPLLPLPPTLPLPVFDLPVFSLPTPFCSYLPAFISLNTDIQP
jgi:hypothetical protein